MKAKTKTKKKNMNKTRNKKNNKDKKDMIPTGLWNPRNPQLLELTHFEENKRIKTRKQWRKNKDQEQEKNKNQDQGMVGGG